MKICMHCKKENKDTAKYCITCGEKIDGSPVWLTTFLIIVGIGTFIVVLGIAINSLTNNTSSDYQVSNNNQIEENKVVSNSFNDFSMLCDTSATSLQKENYFNNHFKDEYVEWTGVVSSISEMWGMYILQVKHCRGTFISDVQIKMNSDQASKLLVYKEGGAITYRAKLISIGELTGISATDGEIVK